MAYPWGTGLPPVLPALFALSGVAGAYTPAPARRSSALLLLLVVFKEEAVDLLFVVLARPDCHEVDEAFPRFQKFLPHCFFYRTSCFSFGKLFALA